MFFCIVEESNTSEEANQSSEYGSVFTPVPSTSDNVSFSPGYVLLPQTRPTECQPQQPSVSSCQGKEK